MKSHKQGKKSSVVTQTKQFKQRLAAGLCTTCGIHLQDSRAKIESSSGNILPFDGVCAHHRTDIPQKRYS